VGNQTPNDIRVLVNGRILGDVPAERTLSFTVRLRQTSPNIFANGVAPTPQTRVNLSANDLTLGIAYPGVTAFLTENQSTYVEFHLFCPRDPEQPCVVSSRVV